MWGGDMPNQFNHSAITYADNLTPTVFSDGNNTDNLLSGEMLYRYGAYGYADELSQNASFISPQSMEPVYHENHYGSAMYYGGPSSKYKLSGTVVGTKSLSNTNQFNPRGNDNKQVVGSNITGAIQGDNIPNSITDQGVQPLNSTSCFEQAQLNFNNLIQFPLKELITNAEKESCMKYTLSILADNLTKLPIEMAEKIVELSIDFPILVLNWKGYCSLSEKYHQQFSAEKENIVATSLVENELRVRYEQLENKEKELITELEAVKKEKAEIDKQMKEKEQRFMKKAAEKLDNLSAEWASLQSFFI